MPRKKSRKIQVLLGLVGLVVLVSLSAASITSSPAVASSNAVACKVFHLTKPWQVTSIVLLTIQTIKVAEAQTTFSRCYNGKRVLRPSVTCDVTFSDAATIQQQGCTHQGYYFSWRGNPYGGYEGMATYTFSVCIAKYGCIGQVNYTTKARLYADGNSEKA